MTITYQGFTGKGIGYLFGHPVVGKDHAFCNCLMNLQMLEKAKKKITKTKT